MDGQAGITKVPARHVSALHPDVLFLFLTLLPFILLFRTPMLDLGFKIQLVFLHKSSDAIKELLQS